MKLTEELRKELEDIYQSLLNDDKVKRMLNIPMHRGSNCYIHSFKVAKLAIKRALRHKVVDLKVLLYACIFHDYYLYDWRANKEYRKGHGKNHPGIAAENAKKDFDIPEKSLNIIKSHMWPINFKRFPNSKEARILSLADKKIASIEALTSKKYKLNKRPEDMKYISSLF